MSGVVDDSIIFVILKKIIINRIVTMIDVKDFIKTVFERYCDFFSFLLDENRNNSFTFKPWQNAWKDENRRSVHESNQVSKFLEAYKAVSNDSAKVLTWMELPIKIPSNKTHHIDGFIVDNNRKEIFFIEAKRNSRQSNIESLREDVKLLFDRREDINREDTFKGLPRSEFVFYIICLVDIWESKSSRTKQLVKAMNDNHFDKICNKKILDAKIKNVSSDYNLYYYLLKY